MERLVLELGRPKGTFQPLTLRMLHAIADRHNGAQQYESAEAFTVVWASLKCDG